MTGPGRLPQGLIMFALSAGGMAAGLAIDLRTFSLQFVGALCATSPSIADSVRLHAALLPATSLCMVAGGLAAAPLRGLWGGAAGRGPVASTIACDLGCNLAMLLGMILCEGIGPRLAASFGQPWMVAGMVGAMAGGMALGAGAWSVLRQAWLASGLAPIGR
jgi:hypothetical protein